MNTGCVSIYLGLNFFQRCFVVFSIQAFCLVSKIFYFCSCLENSIDRGAWRATVHRVAELNVTEHTHIDYI